MNNYLRNTLKSGNLSVFSSIYLTFYTIIANLYTLVIPLLIIMYFQSHNKYYVFFAIPVILYSIAIQIEFIVFRRFRVSIFKMIAFYFLCILFQFMGFYYVFLPVLFLILLRNIEFTLGLRVGLKLVFDNIFKIFFCNIIMFLFSSLVCGFIIDSLFNVPVTDIKNIEIEYIIPYLSYIVVFITYMMGVLNYILYKHIEYKDIMNN